MEQPAGYALAAVSLATALVHTLIPDHWLPFVLVGRARRWSVATTAQVAGLSALIHVAFSLALAFAADAVGRTMAEAAGATLERAGALLLVGFGVAYAVWAWRKGGHFHPGGARLHGSGDGACEGHEGPAHPEHLHYHADVGWLDGSAQHDRWLLAVIVGINPCVLLLPILFAAARRGAAQVALVAGAYSVTTLVLTVGLSALGVAGTRRIRVPLAARHMELASGLLVAALGVVLVLLER